MEKEKMKSCYIIKHDCGIRGSIADLCDYYGKGMILTRINVPQEYRKQGFGNKLLKMILDDADRTKTDIYLEIYASGEMNYDQLKDWYIKNGFVEFATGFFRRRYKR